MGFEETVVPGMGSGGVAVCTAGEGLDTHE